MTNLLKYLSLVVAIIGFYSSTVFGQLLWESKQADVTPSVTDTKAKTVFSFKNVGNYSITVEDIREGALF